MNKFKDEFFRYISFCRSCRYFKNNSDGLVATNMGMAKYIAAYLLLAAMVCVSIFTSRTQLPDGTQVSMSFGYTNWYMWLAAFMLIVAIATRGIQGRLMPMSHRRRTVYYLLRPILISVIVCICATVLFWLVAICIAIVQKLADSIPSADVEITEIPVYLLCPAAYLWFFSSAVFSFFAVLFIAALPPQKTKSATRRGMKRFIADIAEYRRHLALFAVLLFYYLLSFIICNLTPYKPQYGLEFFANPMISLEYLPQWQGWLFAGIMAAAAVIMCASAIIFTYRECKPKNY